MSVTSGDIVVRASPSRTASATRRRLKLFLWGDSGVGKTILALQFPAPAVIDLEGGTEHYADSFDFEVLKATTADETAKAVDWLLANPHPYRTLVIDPITIYWDSLQAKWSEIFLRRNRSSKGHHQEYYSFQAKDWMSIKADFKEFVRKLIALDMNVIVTARQKAQYADGGFMRVAGGTYDAEKSMPYLFDSILRLYRDEHGRFMAENLKDRSNKLPQGCFEVSYGLLEQRLGSESLARQAEPLAMATEDQIARLKHFITAFDMDQTTINQRLVAYGASALENLTEENAHLVIQKFEQAAAARAASTQDHPIGG